MNLVKSGTFKFFAGLGIGTSLSLYSYSYHNKYQTLNDYKSGICGAIGNTPLIELTSLSNLTGCKILAKCEHLNPGGSVKDRAALYMIKDAEKKGLIRHGDTIIEATGGNTGIALALICNKLGYKCVFTMNESLAIEKIEQQQ